MGVFRPNKPRCHLGLSVATTQAAGPQIVVFDVVSEDPTGQADGPPASEITVDKSGHYLVTAGVGRAAIAISSSIDGAIQVDGTSIAASIAPAAATSRQLCVVRAMALEAGQVVRVRATLSGTLSADLQPNLTWLTVERTGPVRWT